MKKPLSHLESAAMTIIADTLHEHDGWLDLARISSRTGRQLVDVRQAVARLVRYGLVAVDEKAPNTERWLKFSIPEASSK